MEADRGQALLQKIGREAREPLPMPRTASKILQLLHKPEVNFENLERVVTSDQAIVAQILKTANSALYGSSHTVPTVSKALFVMGLKTFKNLILTISLHTLYKTKGKQDFISTKLWEHSVGVALCSRILAKKIKMKQNIEEESMVCGLIHDIGKLVLLKYLPKVYAEIIEEVYNMGHSFTDVETEYLGFNHTHVGYMLAKKWKLSEPILSTTLHHHNEKQVLAHKNIFLKIIYLANLMCIKLKIGIEMNESIDLLATAVGQKWNLTQTFLRDLAMQFQDEFEAQKALLLE